MLRSVLIGIFISLISVASSPNIIDYPSKSNINDIEYSDPWIKNKPATFNQNTSLVESDTNSLSLSEPDKGSVTIP